MDNVTEAAQNANLEKQASPGDISSTSDFIMPAEDIVSQKRAFPGNIYGEPPAKKTAPSITLGGGFRWNLQALTHAADAVESGAKSPVSALNELGVKVVYTVLRQSGPAHCPTFNVAVEVAGMKFSGSGPSKRAARASAARGALSALVARAGRVLGAADHDFTEDYVPGLTTVSQFQCTEAQPVPPSTEQNEVTNVDTNIAEPEPPREKECPSTALFGTAPHHSSLPKSPINLLYENYPGLTFTCTFGDGTPLTDAQAPLQLSHSMRFKVVCQIQDKTFEGFGTSKKLAKLAASRAALAQLVAPAPPVAPLAQTGMPQTLADYVAKLVNEKFNELIKNDTVHSKRKVLAGIVMTTNFSMEGAQVIAVTTGTKCVSGEHMSVRGLAVNDCHAEVAARRCLQRYLYSELLAYAEQADPLAGRARSPLAPLAAGGYRLRADRQLHLYVSTAPCGDGRIFSPHEHDQHVDRHPNRQARGQLRTKIESGEGTIPVKNCSNIVQTWDGVMQGERLLTMSCSDKVARWCVAGVQGALLSTLLQPVYFHSLILGSLLHPHHMYRALCGRIEGHISCLPPPFRLARPALARAHSAEARVPARAPSFSVCWSCTSQAPEVLNATTGKLETGQPSLLCKQSMFARWQYLIKRLKTVQQEVDVDRPPVQMPTNFENLLYSEAKQLCPAYQSAKSRLFEAFEKAQLGRWIKKPLEQDQFVCELVNAEPVHLFA